jgi:hypothetical protein
MAHNRKLPEEAVNCRIRPEIAGKGGELLDKAGNLPVFGRKRKWLTPT